jgi:hypothetical protein
MARVAPAVPEETALLCEKCGYIVSGIPMDSLCPECGEPINESLPQNRQLSLWESARSGSFGSFWRTTWQLIFTPGRFFRSLSPRGDKHRTVLFARWHLLLSCTLFGATAFIHGAWAWGDFERMEGMISFFFVMFFAILAWCLLNLTTALATRLTAWEAAYRGLRLPRPVVQRALHFHTAHYLPVAVVAFLTVWGHRVLIHKFPSMDQFGTGYLYVLCGEVILAAGYLFSTYWKGMRNLMYANG